MFDEKVVLVTGGTGSLGKKLVRRILSGERGMPRKVIVFSRDEAKQHDMRVSYLSRKSPTDEVIYQNFARVLEFLIGDVRRQEDVSYAMREAEIVINAGALKQVPTCEYFPEQAILTNCIGAANIVRAAQEPGAKVETVIGISTDKACEPVNVMGMTKALQERIFISANVGSRKTRFICVRYGNVLASRGSVIPYFHEQIRSGGPVTITTADMTRFLFSLDRAVDTIFAALDGALPGEVYIPIAPAATMMNVAKALIGSRPVNISIIGKRPGEKIAEVLVSNEEFSHTVRRGDFYAVRPMLPELNATSTAESPALQRPYSSGDDVLTYEETRELLRTNRLLLEDITQLEASEILV